ncbi:hypothetical protein [Streptomyces sp. WAC01526]|uniref:hypothetical protein n=1 Tax=Streptomyces sp. WAC01526 TaxID=2588709 RepID=UPI0011DF2E1D|nr:hypothetical protein [Streptomyces sp. WAC01526]
MSLEVDEPFALPREYENPTGCNAIGFHLAFFGVKNLEFDGWKNYINKRTEIIKHNPNGVIHTSIADRDELVKFTADSVSIIHSQAKRKAAE